MNSMKATPGQRPGVQCQLSRNRAVNACVSARSHTCLLSPSGFQHSAALSYLLTNEISLSRVTRRIILETYLRLILW